MDTESVKYIGEMLVEKAEDENERKGTRADFESGVCYWCGILNALLEKYGLEPDNCSPPEEDPSTGPKDFSQEEMEEMDREEMEEVEEWEKREEMEEMERMNPEEDPST